MSGDNNNDLYVKCIIICLINEDNNSNLHGGLTTRQTPCMLLYASRLSPSNSPIGRGQQVSTRGTVDRMTLTPLVHGPEPELKPIRASGSSHPAQLGTLTPALVSHVFLHTVVQTAIPRGTRGPSPLSLTSDHRPHRVPLDAGLPDSLPDSSFESRFESLNGRNRQAGQVSVCLGCFYHRLGGLQTIETCFS